jgi:hypothetical protein
MCVDNLGCGMFELKLGSPNMLTSDDQHRGQFSPLSSIGIKPSHAHVVTCTLETVDNHAYADNVEQMRLCCLAREESQ